MEKTLTVTIKVEKDKPAKIEFLEPESGDIKTFKILRKEWDSVYATDLGWEILSWVSIIEDEMEDDLEA